MKQKTLRIKSFAQIEDVSLDFGDLTVLVGAQGTGKSLALQWLKAALDGREIVAALQDAGHETDDPSVLIDLIFGVGMAGGWNKDSEVTFDGKNVLPKRIGRIGTKDGEAFFIPAHRAMLISDGWAAPFQKLTSDTPVVARIFSQNLFDRFSAKTGDRLFPMERVLKTEYREQLSAAVFHGGTIGLEQDRQHAKRLKLTHGDSQLPFMTWTAGQREITPLLLGLYHVLPARQLSKQPSINWVIIEEPEMGLHPQAITVVLLLTLDLLWRGYRVVLSTHSPHLLTGIWMLRRLQEFGASWKLVCHAFEVAHSQQMQRVAKAALEKEYRVHVLAFGKDGRVRSKDISTLDPDSDDDQVSGWGGLTAFSSKFGEAVRMAANAQEK